MPAFALQRLPVRQFHLQQMDRLVQRRVTPFLCWWLELRSAIMLARFFCSNISLMELRGLQFRRRAEWSVCRSGKNIFPANPRDLNTICRNDWPILWQVSWYFAYLLTSRPAQCFHSSSDQPGVGFLTILFFKSGVITFDTVIASIRKSGGIGPALLLVHNLISSVGPEFGNVLHS